MDMSTMTTTTAMSGMAMTTTGMAMASSTSTMDMSSGDSMMTSADMAMVFFQSAATPLYSMSWTPSSDGMYAGACIFLIVLGVIHRVLIATRTVLNETIWKPRPRHSKLAENEDDLLARESLSGATRRVVHNNPFRVATETARALFEVIIGGISYLLMLAVMTMNVGYFLSVLGGIFLGAFLVGRFGAIDSHH